MTGELWVQVLGVVGFVIFGAATQAVVRWRILVVDAVGTLIVAVHYALIHSPGGAVLSVWYAVMDAAGLALKGRLLTVARVTAAPFAFGLALWVGDSRADLVAAAGTAIAAFARLSPNPVTMLRLKAASTGFWGVFGLLVGSWGQVGFSAIYFIACLIGAQRAARAASRPPD